MTEEAVNHMEGK